MLTIDAHVAQGWLLWIVEVFYLHLNITANAKRI